MVVSPGRLKHTESAVSYLDLKVEAFLNEEIKFTDIAEIVEKTMYAHTISKSLSLNSFIEADFWARYYARKLIG